MKKYEFKLVVYEGNDEFWEKYVTGTGCDEVLCLISDTIAAQGLFVGENCELKLVKFTDEDSAA